MSSRPISLLLPGFAGVFLCGSAIGYLLAPRGESPPTEPPPQSMPAAARATPPPADDASRAAAQRARAAASEEETEVTAEMLDAVRNHDYFKRRHDLYELGERLSAAELASAMAAAEAFPGPDRDLAQEALLSAWLRKDADGAMAWARALPAGTHRDHMLSEAFSGLGRMDAPSALRFFADGAGFQFKGERARYLHEIFYGWGESDPAAAAAAVAALPSEEDRENAAEPLLGHWAARDPRAALAWASQRASASEREAGHRKVLHEWASVDPAAASQYAMSQPEGKERRDAIGSVFSAIAEWDIDRAFQMAEGVGSVPLRNELLLHLLTYELGTPQQQVRIIESISPMNNKSYYYSGVAQRFAEKDRAAALDWAANVPGREAHGYALQGVLGEWAEKEPRSALDYAMKNSDSNADLVSSVINTWAGHDSQAALDWATALPEGDLRTKSLLTVLNDIAGQDPLRAIEMAGRTLHPSEPQDSALSSITQTWMRSDLPAVIEWMKRQPEKIQDGLISNVTTEWSQQDPAGAAAWIDQFPKGDRRDKAVGAFVNAVTQTDPEGAAAWAGTISNPEQRHFSIQNVVANWANTDQAAAAAWVRSSNAISPDDRADFLRVIEANQ